MGILALMTDAHVVSSLIGRSETYQAIFARIALITGTLSILVALGVYVNDETKLTIGRSVRAREFATL